MTKRRTEITIETERLLVAHSQRTTRVFCAHCGMEVETTTTQANETPTHARNPAEEPEETSHQP